MKREAVKSLARDACLALRNVGATTQDVTGSRLNETHSQATARGVTTMISAQRA